MNDCFQVDFQLFQIFVAVAEHLIDCFNKRLLQGVLADCPCRAAYLVLQSGLAPPDDCFLAPVVPVQSAEMLTATLAGYYVRKGVVCTESLPPSVHITLG